MLVGRRGSGDASTLCAAGVVVQFCFTHPTVSSQTALAQYSTSRSILVLRVTAAATAVMDAAAAGSRVVTVTACSDCLHTPSHVSTNSSVQ
jgi:hypothetical protein